MTTIAYKSGVIACDRQCSDGGLMSHTTKAIPHGDVIYLGTGALVDTLKFIAWLKDGGYDQDDVKPPELDHSLVVEFNIKTGKVIEWSYEWPLQIEESMYAWGSGSHLAIGAMAMGASPRKAIEIASKWDDGTGMGVRVFGSAASKRRGRCE